MIIKEKNTLIPLRNYDIAVQKILLKFFVMRRFFSGLFAGSLQVRREISSSRVEGHLLTTPYIYYNSVHFCISYLPIRGRKQD